MTKKQIIYVSALINVIVVSFLTGLFLNSQKTEVSQQNSVIQSDKP